MQGEFILRTFSPDPNSRENFILAYKISSTLIKRHHQSNRLRLLSYIDKSKGYYKIYLSQDPASPLSTAFGYFNVSLGNFRSMFDSELYYYFNDYKDGKSVAEIVEKIERMLKISYVQEQETPEDNDYMICLEFLNNIIQTMADRECGFAIENEICPYVGPYSKTPDNQLWFELSEMTEQKHPERCIYDYFVIGTGVPGGPVYQAWAFLSNEGILYIRNHEAVNIIEKHINQVELDSLLDKVIQTNI